MGENVERIRSALTAMDPEQISEPTLPVNQALVEATDLLAIVNKAEIMSGLETVGLEPGTIAALEPAAEGLREAEAEWAVVRDTGKPDAQKKREKRGKDLRQKMLATCRFNLRKQPAALAAVSAIAEGEGIADLLQDLHDLAKLMTAYADSFAKDKSVNVPEVAQEMLSLAKEIDAGRVVVKFSEDRGQTKETRDRAFTYLHNLMSDIREAGKYAFAENPASARLFASEYNRRMRSRRRTSQPETPAA